MFEILHEAPYATEARRAKKYLLTRLPKQGWGIQAIGGKTLNVLLCGEETSASLNNRERGIDKPTDVLSWSYAEEENDFSSVDGEPEIAGEMALCVPVCLRQAEENAWSFEVELTRLIVHGLAHIVGYNHDDAGSEKEMLAFETSLLNKLGLTEVYPSQTGGT